MAENYGQRLAQMAAELTELTERRDAVIAARDDYIRWLLDNKKISRPAVELHSGLKRQRIYQIQRERSRTENGEANRPGNGAAGGDRQRSRRAAR